MLPLPENAFATFPSKLCCSNTFFIFTMPSLTKAPPLDVLNPFIIESSVKLALIPGGMLNILVLLVPLIIVLVIPLPDKLILWGNTTGLLIKEVSTANTMISLLQDWLITSLNEPAVLSILELTVLVTPLMGVPVQTPFTQ